MVKSSRETTLVGNLDMEVKFQEKDIVILGAGIIGCTIARTILEKGFKVKLIAKHIPGDEDIWYASNWAGALFHGAKNLTSDHKYLQAVTYRRFMNDATKVPDCGVCKVKVKELFDDLPNQDDLWYTSLNSNFSELQKSEIGEYSFGCKYDSVTIEPPRYLKFMKTEIEKLGGEFIRKDISDIQEVYDMFHESTIFINASGVGPKYIKGLFDPNSYPNRGQNVLVKTRTDLAVTRTGKEYTYIIPRPLSGVVVCGGINQPDATHSEIDPEIVKDEIKRAHLLAPEIISEDPEISGYVVAIRPARKGGFRLEKVKLENKYMIHCYGFNGKGYAFSYGAAYQVSKLVEEIEREVCIESK